ncbi:MAG: MFS transporter, partial [Alphaproteobacteria bacterium]|nr:MFS transporter [Alphaproteobacteria bacterium]
MTSFSGQSAGGWPLVGALAFGQLVSWGALRYAFTLFVAPMEAELGWSREALNGALSAGLVASALAAYPAGRWIDRFGGRGIMTTGTLLGALMLLAWSRVGDLAVFFAIW